MMFPLPETMCAIRGRLFAVAGTLFCCVMGLFPSPPLRAQKPTPRAPIIIDTDAGADDLMAIAFLLSRHDVQIEAITLANGVAHVPAGGRNILRLLALAQRGDIPVYLGRETPLAGDAEFPAPWRKAADDLPGVMLPDPASKPEPEPAAQFLTERVADRTHAVRLLALGPLTNLAEALDAVPAARRTRTEIVIMGGAFRVRGNLDDGRAFQTDNATAEWNFFIDSVAAGKVLAAGAVPHTGVQIVPLDATNQVPIDSAFLKRLSDGARTELAKSVAQILTTNRELIQQNSYSAWDPLAAVAMVNPSLVHWRCIGVAVRTSPPEKGRTAEISGTAPNACVAFGVDRQRFYDAFLDALEPDAKQPSH